MDTPKNIEQPRLRLFNPPIELEVPNQDRSWAQAVDQIMFALGQPKPPTKLLVELFGVRINGQ